MAKLGKRSGPCGGHNVAKLFFPYPQLPIAYCGSQEYAATLLLAPTRFRESAKQDEKPTNWLAAPQTRSLLWRGNKKEFFKIERTTRECL